MSASMVSFGVRSLPRRPLLWVVVLALAAAVMSCPPRRAPDFAVPLAGE